LVVLEAFRRLWRTSGAFWTRISSFPNWWVDITRIWRRISEVNARVVGTWNEDR
jgi:hypothetical protein